MVLKGKKRFLTNFTKNFVFVSVMWPSVVKSVLYLLCFDLGSDYFIFISAAVTSVCAGESSN